MSLIDGRDIIRLELTNDFKLISRHWGYLQVCLNECNSQAFSSTQSFLFGLLAGLHCKYVLTEETEIMESLDFLDEILSDLYI